jgi:3-methyladenine DNA glycosylase Tag
VIRLDAAVDVAADRLLEQQQLVHARRDVAIAVDGAALVLDLERARGRVVADALDGAGVD